MKNKKNRTLLTGLLLSALTVPLTASQTDAAFITVKAGDPPKTITADTVIDSKTGSWGGAIENEGTVITESGASFTNNEATMHGGAINNWDEAATIKINGTIFNSNTAKNNGGAIYNYLGNMDVKDSSFELNSADDGGAIYNDGITSTITGGIFKNNQADRNGGAVYSDGAINIDGVAFNSNTAENKGGALFVETLEGQESVVSNSTFTENKVTATGSVGGGAIYLEEGKLTVNNSQFTKNTASTQAGTILSNGTLNVTGSTFNENTSGTGGAISAYADLTITDTTFSKNEATNGLGGAVFLGSYSNTKMDNVTFDGNKATESGGAISTRETIYDNSNAILNIANSTFKNNEAGKNGGAIINTFVGTKVENTNFTGNTASNYGGAIYMDNSRADNSNLPTIDITGGTFSKNEAYVGGVIAGYGEVDIKTSQFDSNKADFGGAIYQFLGKDETPTSLKVSDSSFTNNEALSAGAIGVFRKGEITNTEFIGNKATDANDDGGGALLLGAESNTTITGGTFTNNTSAAHGGAIATREPQPGVETGNNKDAKLSIASTVFENNTAATNGGAIYNAFNDVIIEETAFDKNSATGKGGAIYIEESNGGGNVASVNITSESSFTNNTATDEGGAIYNAGSFDIDGVTFTNNSGANGGAIASYSATSDTVSTIKNAVFEENKATGSFEADGGAISLQNGALNVSNTDFNNNTAAVGGAIYTYTKKDATSRDNSLTLDTVNFTGNEATLSGGALMNMNDATITNSTFTNNKVTTATTGEGGSDGGGAIFLGSASTTTITGSTFTGNTSAVDGGAIATRQPLPGDGSSNVGNNTAASLTIADTTFTGNSSSEDGGAIYNSFKNVTVDNTDFSGNTAAGNGGAIYSDVSNGNGDSTDMTLTDASFTNNSATGNGGAIYSASNVTIKADTEDVTFSGNTAADGGDIYMGSETSGSQLTLDTGDNQKTITVDGGISGANNFNTAVNGTGTLDVQSYINNTAMTVNSGSTLWLNEGSSLGTGTTVTMNDNTTLNTINNSVDSFADGVLTMNGTVTISADVNTATGKGDDFSNANIAEGSTIVVSEINSIAGGNNVANGVNILEALGLTDTNADVSFAETQVSNITTAIRKYNGNINSDGMITYTPTGNSYGDFNSAVMVAPVAAQLGGYLTQLQVYDQAFGNFDMYKLGTPEQVQAMKYGNKYAASDANLVYDPINSPYADKAGWFRPYTNFGSVGLKNGPKVDNVLYGTLAGLESEMYDLGNGWDGMFGVYAGYNGSNQKFDGNKIYQNGGTLGVMGMAYKGDFFTGLTANIGANVASADTMYGNEDFTMLMTGVASKTGYNWQLADGKFIIQPSYTMSYSMVNTFDYTNAAGVRINSDPLHAIQVEPGVKFIGNLNNGWQPYAGVSVVMNFLDDTKFKANDTSLPELSVKPYAKYGVGVRKTWGEKFAGFLQTFITSGGRNSVGFQGGFRWTLGKKEPAKANSTGEKKYIKAKA